MSTRFWFITYSFFETCRAQTALLDLGPDGGSGFVWFSQQCEGQFERQERDIQIGFWPGDDHILEPQLVSCQPVDVEDTAGWRGMRFGPDRPESPGLLWEWENFDIARERFIDMHDRDPVSPERQVREKRRSAELRRRIRADTSST